MRRDHSKIAGLTVLAILIVVVLGYIGVRVTLVHPIVAAVRAQPSVATEGSTSARESYADMVDRVAPAVVTIRSARRVRAAQQFPFPDDPFFRQFFGDPNRNLPRETPSLVQHALGSGVIVSVDGYILTNHHVIDGADQITVEMTDRRVLNAKLIGSDAASDLALLKIDASDLPVLTLGDSDMVRVGDICLAVGNPLGIGETVTAGIISARGRATGLSDGSFEDFLQTDAAINQGNSGGALVNTRGELIGINSQILSPSGGNIGIGFAIPSNMAKNVMQQLKDGGKVRRGRLGVGIQAISSDLAKTLGLKDIRGVLVNSVEEGGPADRAGLKAGDVITTLNGAQVDDPNALRNRIAASAPDSEVTLTVVRAGSEKHFSARLSELQPGRDSRDSVSRGDSRAQLGVTVVPLSPDAASRLGVSRNAMGVVVTAIDPESPAALVGLQVDDVILEVNHQQVRSAAELQSALQKSHTDPALLLVSRAGRSIFLAIETR